MWLDIASIIFICVTANHLGLIKAIEEYLDRDFLIISCPKCFSFWSVFAYEMWSVGISDLPLLLAISFLSAYAAIWLELLEGYIDTIYMKYYEKIYNTTADTLTADADNSNTAGNVS